MSDHGFICFLLIVIILCWSAGSVLGTILSAKYQKQINNFLDKIFEFSVGSK